MTKGKRESSRTLSFFLQSLSFSFSSSFSHLKQLTVSSAVLAKLLWINVCPKRTRIFIDVRHASEKILWSGISADACTHSGEALARSAVRNGASFTILSRWVEEISVFASRTISKPITSFETIGRKEEEIS